MRQRAAIYERSARGDLDGVRAVHHRYLALTAWIAEQPGDLVHTHSYFDCGYPATSSTRDRAGLRNVLADARTHTFDVLVVYDLGRLARSPGMLVGLLDELAAARVRLCSITDRLDTSTGARLLSLLTIFANHEAANPQPGGQC
jgi:DNA invertase Pin-like site-specific DNA recombinase